MITAEDVERILGPRPWKSRGDELLEENAALAATAEEEAAEETTSNEPTQNTEDNEMTTD